MHLFQHLVDVDAVTLLPPALPLLVAGADGLGLSGFLSAFSRDSSFGWHFFRVYSKTSRYTKEQRTKITIAEPDQSFAKKVTNSVARNNYSTV